MPTFTRSMLDSGQYLMESILSNTMSTASIAQKLVSGLGRLENQHASSDSTLALLLQRIDQMVWQCH
jgi:HD-like signal output (HDOD) protein